MVRKARQLSQTGIYHIMVRGINGQNIFCDEDDYKRYLDTLARISKEEDAQVFAYCLMSNHIHLLIHEGKDGVSRLMKRLGGSYAYWYNWKYERKGYVFQDRFKSENVEDDTYLKTVVRYIHQNPVKAGIVRNPETYPWSSISAYYANDEYPPGLSETSFVLGLFGNGKKSAVNSFRAYMEENDEDNCLDYPEETRLNDREAEQVLKAYFKGEPLHDIKRMAKKERDELLKEMKGIEGISNRQISRLMGISSTTVHNA